MQEILIEYRLRGDEQYKAKVLQWQDYFDALEGGHKSMFDLIEKHFLEPRDYLPEQRAEITHLVFTIASDDGDKVRTSYAYWNNGQNQLMDHHEFKNGVSDYRTVTLSISVDSKLEIVLRMEEVNGVFLPRTHAILSDRMPIDSLDLREFK